MDFIRQRILALIQRGVRFSDVHIEEGQPFRYRGPMGLVAEDTDPVEGGDVMAFLAQAGVEDAERRLDDLGGHFDFSLTLEQARFRCNLHRYGGLGYHGLVMRKLERQIPDLVEIGLPEVTLHLLQRRAGLILVTGPTGSGKSTTLASLVDHINEHWAAKIITIEDPIEYLHTSKKSMVLQREVGRDVESFQAGLVASFRQDPDCILLGEIRDRQTMETALSAAEAGHLVLTTLHTAGAAKTVDRVADFFVGDEKVQVRSILSSVLVGVVSQALVPKLDGKGYALAYEIMLNTPAIATHIREGKSHQIANTMSTSGVSDMQLMNRSLALMVKAKVIGRDEAKRASYDVKELEKELEGGRDGLRAQA